MKRSVRWWSWSKVKAQGLKTKMMMGSAVAKLTTQLIVNEPKHARAQFRPRSSISATLLTEHPSSSSSSSSTSLGHLTRNDFHILHQEVNGSKLVYLDNAATSQKPDAVITALRNYYESYNSNVHRGIHFLSAKATDEYESARKKVAAFVNAPNSSEIIFTRNATEAINLVAYSWGMSNLQPSDEIALTFAEHHSAVIPWQFVAQKTGAT